jgi:hypothetical protein
MSTARYRSRLTVVALLVAALAAAAPLSIPQPAQAQVAEPVARVEAARFPAGGSAIPTSIVVQATDLTAGTPTVQVVTPFAGGVAGHIYRLSAPPAISVGGVVFDFIWWERRSGGVSRFFSTPEITGPAFRGDVLKAFYYQR